MGELLKDVQFRPPDIVFEHEHNLDLGGIRVRILSLGPTHTPGDTMVWVEEDRVLFAGDVVMNRTFLSFNQDSSARPGCPSSISWRRFAPAPSYPAMETWATPL
jgi:glyoxylase-like metal-dependent hydrolase (beta-lactamase superfamily II)